MENKINIMVCGGRNFADYGLLSKPLDKIIFESTVSNLLGPARAVIVQGDARGADALAKRYAEEHGLEHLDFPADWDKYGKRAGFVRNVEMLNVSQICVAFWDGKSHGTKHSIEKARSLKIPVHVIYYKS